MFSNGLSIRQSGGNSTRGRLLLRLPRGACPKGNHRGWFNRFPSNVKRTKEESSFREKYEWSTVECGTILKAPKRPFTEGLMRHDMIGGISTIDFFVFETSGQTTVASDQDVDRINDVLKLVLSTRASSTLFQVPVHWGDCKSFLASAHSSDFW